MVDYEQRRKNDIGNHRVTKDIIISLGNKLKISHRPLFFTEKVWEEFFRPHFGAMVDNDHSFSWAHKRGSTAPVDHNER
jgi:hypothetical protein